MAPENDAPSVTSDDIIGRMMTRIDREIPWQVAEGQRRNAAAFLAYLLETGLTDEDELFELTLLASGKRYDPTDGSFS